VSASTCWESGRAAAASHSSCSKRLIRRTNGALTTWRRSSRVRPRSALAIPSPSWLRLHLILRRPRVPLPTWRWSSLSIPAAELTALAEAIGQTGQIPREIDGRLLARGGAALGRALDSAQKKAVRAAFFHACKLLLDDQG
jgi:hypothetical protein